MIHLAILWHQHQPYYQDTRTGEMVLPWVRMHAIKDYYGMAAILKEFPNFHCNINLVPSMLQQLEDYINGKGFDRHQTVSLKNPADLTEEEKIFILDNFFMANWDRMVLPIPRYHELLCKRDFDHKKAFEAIKDYSPQDYIDLTVWFELIWMHPLLQTGDALISALIKKGRDFTLEERANLFLKEKEILKTIIPLHRELSERGQVEISTTPFYHPILPLLLNRDCAKQAMPEVFLPTKPFRHPEDADEQIRRAVQKHEALFGIKPDGMWPSEGSVSPEVLATAAKNGLRWLATDEEILANTQGLHFGRDFGGELQHPDDLCQPFLAATENGPVQMIFREHYLSDIIGFKYQWMSAQDAVNDFIRRLHEIGKRSRNKNILVPVILDGENCWEYYPGGGLEFLRLLYGTIVKDQHIKPVCISEYLKEFPAKRELSNIYSGSWINHNFGIWIGHPEDNKGWDMLADARDLYAKKEQDKKIPADQLARAKESLLIAEGSDWFWWFGDDHSSLNDAQFDALFRLHVSNVYRYLDENPPEELSLPIKKDLGGPPFATPRGFLHVTLDGKVTDETEWVGAGLYERRRDAGAMSAASEEFLGNFYFGYSHDHFFLRVNRADLLRDALTNDARLVVVFTEPHPKRLVVALDKGTLRHYELHGQHNEIAFGTFIAMDEILELAVPWRDLLWESDRVVKFNIILEKDGKELERIPKYVPVSFSVPRV